MTSAEQNKAKMEIWRRASFAMIWRTVLLQIVFAIPFSILIIRSNIKLGDNNSGPALIILGTMLLDCVVYFLSAKLFLLSSLTKPRKHYALALEIDDYDFGHYIFKWMGIAFGLEIGVTIIGNVLHLNMHNWSTPLTIVGCMLGTLFVINSLLKNEDAILQPSHSLENLTMEGE